MNRILSGAASGLIFGLGIAISGMGNPLKVENFYDLFVTWNPSLAFVMGGALITTDIGYRLAFGRAKTPKFDTAFYVPTARTIDAKRVGGSAPFDIGWGISGFCPGEAIPALGFAPLPTRLFPSAMGAGIVLARWLQPQPRPQTA